jgi:hypothetical protein
MDILTVRLTLDQKNFQRWESMEFQRAIKDGNLPASIDAWADSSGYIVSPDGILWKDEVLAAGDDVTEHDWTDEAGCDHDGTTIIHEIDVTSGVHSLYLLDNSNTGNINVSKTFPVTVGVGKVLRIKALNNNPVNCPGTTWTYLNIQLNEGATVGVNIRLVMGYGGVVFYTTDGGTTWLSTSFVGITPGYGPMYLFIKMDSLSTYSLGSGYTTASPTYTAPLDMDNALSVGWDNIVLSTPVAHGYEGFGSYTPAGAAITGGYWNAWNALCSGHGTHTCYSFVESSGKALMTNLVAEASVSFPIYTFGTAQPNAASGWVQFTVNNSVIHNAYTILDYCTAAAALQIRLTLYRSATMELHVLDNLTERTVCTLALSTAYTVRVNCITASTYDIIVNGTTYDNGGAHYAKYNGTSAALGLLRIIKANTESTGVYTLDDIVTSWATAGPDVDAISAVLYEIWTDEVVGETTLANIKGKQLQVFINDKQAWKGWIMQYERNVQTMNNTIKLTARDEFYPSTKKDTAISNVLYTGVIGAPTLNEVPVVPDVPSADLVNGQWCVIRHNSGQLFHDDITRGGTTLASAQAVSCTLAGSAISEVNTFAKTAAKDNDTHNLDITSSTYKGNYPEAVYVMELAEDTDELVDGGRLRIVGTSGHYPSASRQRCDIYMWNYEATVPAYERVGTLGWCPGGIGYEYNVPANFVGDIPPKYITTTGGKWTAKVQLKVFNEPWLGLQSSNRCIWYIDQLRLDIKTRVVTGYIPIEARIDSTDAGLDKIDINSIPYAVQNCITDDTIMISRSIQAALVASLMMLSNVECLIDDTFGAMTVDDRGNNGYETFKNITARTGIDWWLDVNEDDAYNSVLHAQSNKEFCDVAGIITGTEIQNVPGWGRHATNDYRVTVQRTDQIGGYLQFKTVGGHHQHDSVYRLISADLDTAPDRALKSFEIYLSFSGTNPDVGESKTLSIVFSDSDNPDDFGAKPWIACAYYNNAGTFEWHVQANDGNGHTSDLDVAEKDGNKTMGIRVEFDYTLGTMVASWREIVTDGTRKLSDRWIAIGDQADFDVADGAPRSIGFYDGSGGIGAWTAYICAHQLKLEFDPATFADTITPRGNITIQSKDSNVHTLKVIGAKNADGNEMEIGPVDVDTEGADRVELHTGIQSLAELQRYVDMYIENYETNKVAIRFQDMHDDQNVYHPGWTYTFTVDGVSYTERLRRAGCKIDGDKHEVRWTLEFGGGQTFGSELLYNALHKNDRAINELRLK